jgi:peptidase A4-like protein
VRPARIRQSVAVVLSGTAVGWGAFLLPASASAAVSVSSNWAGYVASAPTGPGSRFTSISGYWTQPKATCAAGAEAYSAVWVGLGGYSEHARALEQIGTDADCTRSGSARYSSWYELLSAGPVTLTLSVHPGDAMSASATVKGAVVTLRIRDLTTGARFARTLRVPSADVSSAEWIVEAPSVCPSTGFCATLPLTNFGTIQFSNATATAQGHTSTVSDRHWSTAALELRQRRGAHGPGPAPSRNLSADALRVATPSQASNSDGSFAVTWHEQRIQVEAPTVTTLPGLNGSPP